MKKALLLVLFACLIIIPAIAQNATNFTADDCNGNTHNLFEELDSGKVVVICWVMPCSSCTGPALTAYNIVSYYQTNFPGKVLYYMIDDYANTPCSSLDSWATSKGIPANNYSFRFVNAAIKMSDYGTDGMPKTIVVGGGSSHKVFYNENFTLDPDEMMIAVDLAMQSTGITNITQVNQEAVIYPNPGIDWINVNIHSDKVAASTIQVFNISGNLIKEYSTSFMQGENKIPLNISSVPKGLYFLKIKESGTVISKFVITR